MIIIIYTQRKTKNNKRNGRSNNKQQQQQQTDKQKSKDQINNKITEENMNSVNMNDPGSASILMSSLMSNQHPNVILNDNNYYYHHNYTSAIPSSSSSLDHNYLSLQSKLQQPDVIVHQTSSSPNPKQNPTPSPGHRQVLPGVSVIESMKKQINFSMNIDCSNCLCDDCSSCYNSNDDSQQHGHQQKSCHQMSVNPSQANVTYCSYCLSSTPSPIDGGLNHHVNCLGELKNLSNDNSQQQQQQTVLINGVIVGVNELSPTKFPGRITTV